MKQAILSISGVLGVDRLFAYLNRNRPVVLVFHGVTADPPGHFCNHEGMHLYRPLFEGLMEFIARRYNPVALGTIVDWLGGDVSLPDRAVAVTFDDGYRNVLTEAAPVLARLGIPGTLFVATDFVFRKDPLWTDRLTGALYLTREPRLSLEMDGGTVELSLSNEADKIAAENRLLSLCKKLPDSDRVALVDRIVASLAVDEARVSRAWGDHAAISPEELPRRFDDGLDVGSHTCTHAIVSRMRGEQMDFELAESRRLIESATGRPCTLFSYPNGGPADFDARTRRAVVAAGYRGAVTTIKTAVTPLQDRFEIPRCTLTHNHITLREFAAEVSGFPRFLRGAKARVTGRDPLTGGSWPANGDPA
ncbi:MAG TPA: polysaccharide deacetylase family protein [Candidatus Krumholzibacteria bacterium]|nr:polysaccharide deacetylase family protein [Candidatus Krumholzibacteria bacterium]